MGLRATVVRLRSDARRPASWLALAAGAAATWWLAAAPGAWWPAAAVVAGAVVTVAAIGAPPRDGAGGQAAWGAARAAWAIAGAAGAWLACGAGPGNAAVFAVLLGACGGTAVALVVGARAGLTPADAAGAALGLAEAAALAAAVATLVAPASVPRACAAAVAGWCAAAAVAALGRWTRAAAEPRGRGLSHATVPRAVMVSALAGMVTCLYLAPRTAWGYAALAVAWLVAAAIPQAALGPGPAGEAARRALLATAGGPAVAPARVAARVVATYAAVLVWPPLVVAALAGTVGAATEPLAIAALIGAWALGLGAAVAGPLAMGGSRETALALALSTALAGFAAWVEAGWRAGAPPLPPPGLMLSNPADPARLAEPREEPRRPYRLRGVAS